MQYVDSIKNEISLLADDKDIEGLRKLIQREWDDIHANSQLSWAAGWALVRLSLPREGIWLLERACELDPADARLPYSVAVAKTAAATLLMQEAEMNLRGSLRIRDSWKARVALSELLMQQDRAEEGEEILRQGMLGAGHVSREHLLDLADYLECVGKDDEARHLRSKVRVANAV